MKNLKRKKFYDEVKKICRYIFKPATVTAIITGILIAILVFALNFFDMFEIFIVSMDVKYNSPVIIGLAGAFTIVLVGACGYGIYLSLHKYKRPGSKGIFSTKYSNGLSYKALNSVLNKTNQIGKDVNSSEAK